MSVKIRVLKFIESVVHTRKSELAGIDIGLQLGHTHLLTYSACSLRLLQGYMNRLFTYRHNIHRDTLIYITHTLKTRCDSGIRTHLGKSKPKTTH
jgi:hypothetical protein